MAGTTGLEPVVKGFGDLNTNLRAPKIITLK